MPKAEQTQPARPKTIEELLELVMNNLYDCCGVLEREKPYITHHAEMLLLAGSLGLVAESLQAISRRLGMGDIDPLEGE